jgi:hypothetical protein
MEPPAVGGEALDAARAARRYRGIDVVVVHGHYGRYSPYLRPGICTTYDTCLIERLDRRL